MISEQQQEQASLYVLGALAASERAAFEEAVRAQPELSQLVRGLQRATGLLAQALPSSPPPPALRDKILRGIERLGPVPEPPAPRPLELAPGFQFMAAGDPAGWKQLPVRGASIKLLSLDRERRFAVVLGRLEAGVVYPAHTHDGFEDLFILTGDLHIGRRRLGPGDFHHSDAGTSHPENVSVDGCTLLAVLSMDHALARFAMEDQPA